MNQEKKSLIVPVILAVVVFLELAVIVILLILINRPSEQVSDDTLDIHEYCMIEEADDKICDAYHDEIIMDGYIHYVDPEIYGESFLMTYSAIRKGELVGDDAFQNFVVLSEHYSSDHLSQAITGVNPPTTYHTSLSRRNEREGYAYPYGVVRNISLDIPNEGCASFDFFPDFSFLYRYSLEDRSCNESF